MSAPVVTVSQIAQPSPRLKLVDSMMSGSPWMESITGRIQANEVLNLCGQDGKQSVQLEGEDAVIAVDGAPAMFEPRGLLRLHGADWALPKKLLHFSRNSSGSSINGSRLRGVVCDGNSKLAHCVNDGAEGFMVESCHFEQYQPEASAFIISNKNRLDDPTPSPARTRTCSWHLFQMTGLYAWGGTVKDPSDRTRPACLRITGTATGVKIDTVWFTGNVPGIVIVDEPDESWPGGGTWNRPCDIIVEDSTSESAESREIALYGASYANLLHYATLSEHIWYEEYLEDGVEKRRRILTLRGNSIESFDVNFYP